MGRRQKVNRTQGATVGSKTEGDVNYSAREAGRSHVMPEYQVGQEGSIDIPAMPKTENQGSQFAILSLDD
jgi:hypothetical protein